MSPELTRKLLQRSKQRRAYVLRILGYGLDAIIQHVQTPPSGIFERTFHLRGFDDRRMPMEPTPQQRLDRYHTAMSLFDPGTVEDVVRRAVRGERVKARVRLLAMPRTNTSVVRLDDARRRVMKWSKGGAA